jgi:hypothetical protein
MLIRCPVGRTLSSAARRYARFAACTSLSIPVPSLTRRRATGRRSSNSDPSVPCTTFVDFNRKRFRLTDLSITAACDASRPNASKLKTDPGPHAAAYCHDCEYRPPSVPEANRPFLQRRAGYDPSQTPQIFWSYFARAAGSLPSARNGWN